MIESYRNFEIKTSDNNKGNWNSISVSIVHQEDHPIDECWSWNYDDIMFDNEKHALKYGKTVVDIICKARGIK